MIFSLCCVNLWEFLPAWFYMIGACWLEGTLPVTTLLLSDSFQHLWKHWFLLKPRSKTKPVLTPSLPLDPLSLFFFTWGSLATEVVLTVPPKNDLGFLFWIFLYLEVSLYFYSSVWFLEIGSYYVAKLSLQPTAVFLPRPPEYWDYKRVAATCVLDSASWWQISASSASGVCHSFPLPPCKSFSWFSGSAFFLVSLLRDFSFHCVCVWGVCVGACLEFLSIFISNACVT